MQTDEQDRHHQRVLRAMAGYARSRQQRREIALQAVTATAESTEKAQLREQAARDR